MKKKWNEIVKEQRELGKDHKTRLRNLERLYHGHIIETNRLLEKMIKDRATENNCELIIVRVEYYNVYGQACDVDALWLSTDPVRITNRVSLFDNVIQGRGKYDGIVKKIYQVPVSDKKYDTVACPLNHRVMWSAEEIM